MPRAARILVTCVFCLLLSSCSRFICDHDKGAEATRPDGRLTASVVHVGCGATSKDATWVTLHRADDRYDRSDDIVLSVAKKSPVELRWIDDTHLSVICRCSDNDVIFQAVKFNGMNITYR
jgi:hypothetical protein